MNEEADEEHERRPRSRGTEQLNGFLGDNEEQAMRKAAVEDGLRRAWPHLLHAH